MASSELQWSCHFCTLINATNDKHCVACENERYDSGPVLQPLINYGVVKKDPAPVPDKTSHLIGGLRRGYSDEGDDMDTLERRNVHSMDTVESSYLDHNAPSFQLLPLQTKIVPRPSSQHVAKNQSEQLQLLDAELTAKSSVKGFKENRPHRSSIADHQSRNLMLFDEQNKPKFGSSQKSSSLQAKWLPTIFDSNSTEEGIEWECSVCTNMNLLNYTKCELCDTKRIENQDGDRRKIISETWKPTSRPELSTETSCKGSALNCK